jgi:hypothetical protein
MPIKLKYKNYANNRLTEPILHEIVLWRCKKRILKVCWQTLKSPYVSYKRCDYRSDI